jgi:glycosyltransferase 2 family protein
MRHFKKPSRNFLFVSLGFFVTGMLLFWLFSQINANQFWATLKKIPISSLVISGMIACAIPFFAACRWFGVLKAQRGLKVYFLLALRMVLFAIALYPFLPAKGGDIVKLLYLRKHIKTFLMTSLIIFERLIDIFIIGSLCFLGSWWSQWYTGLKIGGILVLIISIIFSIIIFIRIKNYSLFWNDFKAIQHVIKNWFSSPRCIIMTILGSFLVWALTVAITVSLIFAIGKGYCWPRAIAVWPIAILIGLLPISFGGIGTRDAAFAILMTGYLSIEEAAIISIGYTLFAYVLLPVICMPIACWEIKKGLYKGTNSELDELDGVPGINLRLVSFFKLIK